MKFKILSFLLIITLLFSCNNDDTEETVCSGTHITLTINGEKQYFQAVGRGITLTNNGYVLEINLHRSIGYLTSYSEQIYLSLPYKQTGENIIEEFKYLKQAQNEVIQGDFLDYTFNSFVTTNTATCFEASFSGVLNDGVNEVIITDGYIRYKYEDPFD